MKQSRIRITNWETGVEEDVLIRSEQATETIVLHSLDVDFIEEDFNTSGAKNGNLDVIVNEGLINIDWELI